MIDLVNEIKANPKDCIGKAFNAECKFKVENGFHTCQMQMKILDIRSAVMKIEPADKSSEDARILKKYWFVSDIEDDYSEHFIISLVFATPNHFAVYCKFLEWVE